MLRDIESKLAGLVEGTFGRLFRSEVTPAELARGLAREMEETRREGVDRTWAAPHYDVFLSPADYRKLAPSEAELLAAAPVEQACRRANGGCSCLQVVTPRYATITG